VDQIDRALIAELQRDAGQAYAVLGRAVGLSPGAAHDRVRKLRERGVIRSTTVDVDPAALDRGLLAYVMVNANTWMGDSVSAFADLPEIQEAHIIAGAASVLVKVRTGTTEQLQGVLRRIFQIPGVTGTQAIVVLETMFERPVDPRPGPTG
jgi:Lrp/AsnC family transcriptional regulator, leucine-responsive regulatory protein